MRPYILGIWDGHDSGVALVKGQTLCFAINEERLSGRKSDAAFPLLSIQAALQHEGIGPDDIHAIAFSTSDFTKTLTRFFPTIKERYYALRRGAKEHQEGFAPINSFMRRYKYLVTLPGTNPLFRMLSVYKMKKQLASLGFNKKPLFAFDHHQCHAEAAARLSGFSKSLVITLDGLGDGLSGTISTFHRGKLERKAAISSNHSFGIFFEHVTALLHMRELEDEGKVMALADYAQPTEKSKNPMTHFFSIDGITVNSAYNPLRMYDELKQLRQSCSAKQFAFFAQQALEHWIEKLARSALLCFPHKYLCLAGGVFANIKVNRNLRAIAGVKGLFVFPHMGDGGLALGSALALNHRLHNVKRYSLDNVFLGDSHDADSIEQELRNKGLRYRLVKSPAATASKLITSNHAIIWYQGRMEYGPRALGHRSILAMPNSTEIKDFINVHIKKRSWYQPFCPSMLLEEAKTLLSDYRGHQNFFMTEAYHVKETHQSHLKGVVSNDGTCRPHMVTPKDAEFYFLLKSIKKRTGYGVVLNTSLNRHRHPLACTPQDAVGVFLSAPIKHMIIGPFHVRKK